MTLDFTEIVNKIKAIEHRFNASQDPIERMACLNAINHIAEYELKFNEKDWVYQQYYKASLKNFGVNYDVCMG